MSNVQDSPAEKTQSGSTKHTARQTKQQCNSMRHKHRDNLIIVRLKKREKTDLKGKNETIN